jgi:hypothetical protein
MIFNNHKPLIQPSKCIRRSPKNRPPDPSEICALDFKGEFRQSAICSASATIDIYWSYSSSAHRRPRGSYASPKGRHERLR